MICNRAVLNQKRNQLVQRAAQRATARRVSVGLATGGLSITVTVTVFRAAWAGGRVSQKTFFVFWEPIVRVGPFYVPGVTACFVCHESAVRAHSIAYDAYVEHVQAAPIRSATLGPASAIVGSILAMEMVHLLLGVDFATQGAALSVDLGTLEVRREIVPRDEACDVCGSC